MKKVDFLKGSISKEMVLFAIPIFLGNLFQQLYNAADSLIVGNFLGSDSLAAVASTGAIHFIPMIQVVFWAYPLTWAISSVIFLIYYKKVDWVHGK